MEVPIRFRPTIHMFDADIILAIGNSMVGLQFGALKPFAETTISTINPNGIIDNNSKRIALNVR